MCCRDGGMFTKTGWLSPQSNMPDAVEGMAALRAMRSRDAITSFQRAMDATRLRPAATDSQLQALAMLSLSYATLGETENANHSVARLKSLLEEPPPEASALVELVISALIVSGIVANEQGDLEKAKLYFRTAAHHIDEDRQGYPLLIASMLYFAAESNARLGDRSTAMACSEKAYEIFNDVKYDLPCEFVYAASQYATVLALTGHLSQADELLKELDGFCQSRRGKLGLSVAHLNFAHAILAHRSQQDRAALSHCRESTKIIVLLAGETSLSEIPNRILMSQLLDATGERERSEQLISATINEYRTKFGSAHPTLRLLSTEVRRVNKSQDGVGADE
jgi:hypothetical protein